MSFLHLNFLPGLILAFVVFLMVTLLLEKRFFRLVKTYWFYRRSLFSYLSTLFFLSGMGVLLLSLLDARGPEQKIKTPVPKERTIILIDTSASMLAEDVKPSRLQKAALIAKHFARKAAGQQISVVAFSEIQKKIVPFTNDLDLIDARLDSLKNLRNQYGSSALTLAIQESIQYFIETGDEARGNILVLTDGEETSEGIKLKIPKDIRVALVGIGTSQGGRIPLDDGRGFRYGYKRSGSQDVITKLNESFFQSTVGDIPSAKYWIANTYSLPSEEIVDFFKSEEMKGQNQQDMTIRPVMMEWIVIPAILALMASYLFKFVRVFTLGILLFSFLTHAQEKEAPLPPELQERLSQLSEGRMTKLERLKLAQDLYQNGAKSEALSLYEETLPMPKIDKDLPPEAYLNYGTALLDSKEELKGLSVYQSLQDSLPKDSSKARELKEMMDKNIVTHFRQQEQKKKEQQEKDKQKKQDQNNQDQSGQGQNQKDGKPQEGQSSQQQKPQDQKKPSPQDRQDKKDENKDKSDEKDKKDDKGDKGEEDKEKKDKDTNDQKDDQSQEQAKVRAQKKVDPKLRQLMDDDRQLQLKMIENGTRDLNKRRSRKSKDW